MAEVPCVTASGGSSSARASVIVPGTRRPRKRNTDEEPESDSTSGFKDVLMEFCQRPEPEMVPPRSIHDACDTELFLMSLLPSLKELSVDDRDNCKLELQKTVIAFKQKRHHSQRGGSRPFVTPVPLRRSSNSSPAGGFSMRSPPTPMSGHAATPSPCPSPLPSACPSPLEIQQQYDAWNGTNSYSFSSMLSQ